MNKSGNGNKDFISLPSKSGAIIFLTVDILILIAALIEDFFLDLVYFSAGFDHSACLTIILTIWGFSTVIVSWMISNIDIRHCGIRSVDVMRARYGNILLGLYAAANVVELAFSIIGALEHDGVILLGCLLSISLLMLFSITVLVLSNYWKAIKDFVISDNFAFFQTLTDSKSQDFSVNFEELDEKRWLLASMIQNINFESGYETAQLSSILKLSGEEIFKDVTGKPNKGDLNSSLSQLSYNIFSLTATYCKNNEILFNILKSWIYEIIAYEPNDINAKLELIRGTVTGISDVRNCCDTFDDVKVLYASLNKDKKDSVFSNYLASWYIVNNCYMGTLPYEYGRVTMAKRFYYLNLEQLGEENTKNLMRTLWDLYYIRQNGKENLMGIISV